MILPRGITGFYDSRRDQVPPVVDVKEFARACYSVARAEFGVVENLESANYSINFHRAILRTRDEIVAVLCNGHFPWLAFAKTHSRNYDFTFMESAVLACQFSDAMRCEVIGLASLEEHPDEASLADLSEIERSQIKYWRPRRLGDIIFNFWD